MENSHNSADAPQNASDSEVTHWISPCGYGPRIIKWFQDPTSYLYQQAAPQAVSDWPSIPWLDDPDRSLRSKREMLKQSLRLLERCYLIEFSESDRLIIIKPWIRQCAINSMHRERSSLRTYALRSLITISQVIDGKYDNESTIFRQSLLSHVKAHKDTYPDRQGLFEMLNVRSALLLCMKLSLVYYQSGEIGSAKEIQDAAVKRANSSPLDDDLLLQAKSQLAASLFSLDGYQDRERAMELRYDVMKRRKVLWQNQREKLSWRAYIHSLSDLADSYDHIPAKVRETVAYREEVLEALRNWGRGGSEEERTEATLRLARSYYRSGQRNKALQLRSRVFTNITGLRIESLSLARLEKKNR